MYKKYLKRIVFCVCALALYGLGCFLGVKAGVAGTNAWNTLSLGLSERFGISFGTGTFLISLVIILVDIVGRGKLGIGTILNVLLIPVFSDTFIALFAFIPNASNAFLGAVLTLLGQVVISFATILYMSPALGCGPRDTLMIIIGKKIPGVPIGTVKFSIEIVVLLVGFLMGAPVGLGTVLALLLQASIFQLVCRITRYEPRSIEHEDVVDTLRKFLGK